MTKFIYCWDKYFVNFMLFFILEKIFNSYLTRFFSDTCHYMYHITIFFNTCQEKGVSISLICSSELNYYMIYNAIF